MSGKQGIDGIDKVIPFFPAGARKMLERVLARAAALEADAAGRNVAAALRKLGAGSRRGRKVGGLLAGELFKAPQGGGRPFHFAHSVVNKGDAAPAAGGRATAGADKGKAGTAASGGGKPGRAAAHMRYIERQLAVESAYGTAAELGRDAPASKDRGEPTADVERGSGAFERRPDDVHGTSAGAGQGYIENPKKLANGEKIVFSFGTIGETFDDRVRFWEALEEAEAHPSARVQHRLIVELPHEASPQARFDIVKKFVERIGRDGIPYWAALHAPGKNNDHRNFYAHIVYSERPAKLMKDPRNPDGPDAWDFSITQTYKKRSRNVVTSRPFRQEKLRSYNAKDFIRKLRHEFSAVANEVLARDGVKDAGGADVRYDARSYKDMGVDAVPMRSINRIVADKMRDGQLTVLDGDYTKRMIAAELREAAAKRDKGVMDLVALDGILRATAAADQPGRMNPKLPRDMRLSPWANPSKAALKAAGRKIMAARHEALHVDVMERATVASLERVVKATAPKAVAAAAKSRNPVIRAAAPGADAAALLHAAALDELEATRASTAKARRTTAYRIGAAVNAWRELVDVPPPAMSPQVKAMLAEEARTEDRGRAAPQQAARPRTPEPGREAPAQGAAGRDSRADDLARGTAAEGTARSSGRATEAPSRQPSKEVAAKASTSPPRRDAGNAPPAPQGGKAVPGEPARRPSGYVRGAEPSAMTPLAKIEDVFGKPRIVTSKELAEASGMISGWLRRIMESSEDVGERMAMLDDLMEKITAYSRSGRRHPGGAEKVFQEVERSAADKAATKAEPSKETAAPTGRDPGPRAPSVDPSSAAVKADDRQSTSARSPPAAPDAGTPAATAGAARDVAEAAPETPPVTPRPSPVEVRQPAPMARAPRPEPEGQAEAGEDHTPPRARSPSGKAASADPELDLSEHPDDARRRRKREEEEKKRKQQRKAVLARRNKGRGGR